jgi:hypothetical protein
MKKIENKTWYKKTQANFLKKSRVSLALVVQLKKKAKVA